MAEIKITDASLAGLKDKVVIVTGTTPSDPTIRYPSFDPLTYTNLHHRQFLRDRARHSPAPPLARRIRDRHRPARARRGRRDLGAIHLPEWQRSRMAAFSRNLQDGPGAPRPGRPRLRQCRHRPEHGLRQRDRARQERGPEGADQRNPRRQSEGRHQHGYARRPLHPPEPEQRQRRHQRLRDGAAALPRG